ncbi:hypothetical protein SDC9_120143 [bioreactor metagenome]|uniref:Terminase small subunit n=1 Tax=bioreactor metagenome TaxID=1076179 RepID=A0A645C7K7_9ZZZZ
MGLTRKQMAFVAAFHGNASEAARMAGYSARTAKAIGFELLTKPDIADAIREREEKRVNSLILSREERQIFWSNVVRDPDEDMKNRLKASELLGRSEADFLEKWLDTTPPTPPSIIVSFIDAQDRQPALDS